MEELMKTQREVERLMEKYQQTHNQSPPRQPLQDSINQFMENIMTKSFRDQERSLTELDKNLNSQSLIKESDVNLLV
jgi:hypothetical protein